MRATIFLLVLLSSLALSLVLEPLDRAKPLNRGEAHAGEPPERHQPSPLNGGVLYTTVWVLSGTGVF